MKELFEWILKSKVELEEIWEIAIFVPDANVLLHCLRYSAKAKDTLLGALEAKGDSLWIPYQVGLEFLRNRVDVEIASFDAYDEMEKRYTEAFKSVRNYLGQLRAHPTIDKDSEEEALVKYLSGLKERLADAKKNHSKTEIEQIVDQVTKMFEGRIGQRWTKADLDALKKEGETRYEQRVPPGYMDADKNDDYEYKKFGDLIIWKEMIKKAKSEKRPVIFITNDTKEDWWRIHKGRKFGPRPELLEEFKRETGQEFHIYNVNRFIELSVDDLKISKKDGDAVKKNLRQDSKAKELQTIPNIRIDQIESDKKNVEFHINTKDSAQLHFTGYSETQLNVACWKFANKMGRISDIGPIIGTEEATQYIHLTTKSKMVSIKSLIEIFLEEVDGVLPWK